MVARHSPSMNFLACLALLAFIALDACFIHAYTYHRKRARRRSAEGSRDTPNNSTIASGARLETVVERINSAEELWYNAKHFWKTHGPGYAWPMAVEAIRVDPLDPVSLFNAAIIREQLENITNISDITGPTQTALLTQAHSLAWQYDLRFKAAWNLALINEGQHFASKSLKSCLGTIRAWINVLDVPMLPKNAEKQARAKIIKYQEEALILGHKTSSAEMGSESSQTHPAALSSMKTLDVLLSLMHHDEETNGYHGGDVARPVLETMDIQSLEAVGKLLRCLATRYTAIFFATGIHDEESILNVNWENMVNLCCGDSGKDLSRYFSSLKQQKRAQLKSLVGFIYTVYVSISRPRLHREESRRLWLSSEHEDQCKQSENSCESKSRPDVLIVGAGPSGLSTALSAFRDGAGSVSVKEKRADAPSRQHWFDADPQTMGLLYDWGLRRYIPVPMQLSPGMPGYATFQCHILERFLRLVVYSAVGIDADDYIDIQLGVSFEGFEKDGAAHVARFRNHGTLLRDSKEQNKDSILDKVSFDLLFACDGANSAVRDAAEVKFEQQSTFLPFREEMGKRRNETSIRRKQEMGLRRLAQLKGTFKQSSMAGTSDQESMLLLNKSPVLNGLSQTTMILAFENVSNGSSTSCPEYHEKLDAFAPALADISGGITAVFKRLYTPFCEFQILLSHKIASSIKISSDAGNTIEGIPMNQIFVDEDFFPWHSILSAANLLFVDPFESITSLRKALRPYQYFNGDSQASVPRHAVLFRTGIQRASSSAVSLGDSIVIFRGDALISAHYRMGIGINQAFASLEKEVSAIILQWRSFVDMTMGTFLNLFGDYPIPFNSEEIAERHRARADPRVTWMSDIQLFTMFFEAYCDVIVDNSDLHDLVLLKKIRGNQKIRGHVSSEPLTDKEIQQLPCMTEWLDFSRNGAP